MPLGCFASSSVIASTSIPLLARCHEVPDDGLEQFAAPAFRCAVANQVVIVRPVLLAGVVEIEAAIGLLSRLPGVACKQCVDEAVDRRQLNPGAALERAHGNIALRVTVDFETGASVAVESKPALLVVSVGKADDAAPGSADGCFLIRAAGICQYLLGPVFDFAALQLDAMVEIDGADAGTHQRVPDAVGVAGPHGCDRVLMSAPGVRIIRFSVIRRILRVVWRLGPFPLPVFRGALLPAPHHPARLHCQRLQRRRKVCEIVVCVRFGVHGLPPSLRNNEKRYLPCLSVGSRQTVREAMS